MAGRTAWRRLRDESLRDPEYAAGMPEARRRVQEEIREHEVRLAELRKGRLLSQSELAERLGVHQTQVSRVERGDDPQVSTLRAYVEALGGELEIVASFGEERIRIELPRKVEAAAA
jgi:DNA-binding XRE family transcriptional regulator